MPKQASCLLFSLNLKVDQVYSLYVLWIILNGITSKNNMACCATRVWVCAVATYSLQNAFCCANCDSASELKLRLQRAPTNQQVTGDVQMKNVKLFLTDPISTEYNLTKTNAKPMVYELWEVSWDMPEMCLHYGEELIFLINFGLNMITFSWCILAAVHTSMITRTIWQSMTWNNVIIL